MSTWSATTAAPDMPANGEAVSMTEHASGPDETVVVYSFPELGTPISPGAMYGEIARDAALRAAGGWLIVSTDTLQMRPTGSPGNVLFGVPGRSSTRAAIAVVYRRP